MANSLEARVPFLDHELVELAAQIPPHLKMRCLREKHILRRAAADLLPPQVVTRRKRGLRAPVHQWLEDPLPGFAEDLLSRSALRRKGYFNPEGVRQALAERRSGNTSHSWELLGVIGVQLWDELFMQGNGPSLR
jgi:asparagine synthase (glutamine-hydrolysing)